MAITDIVRNTDLEPGDYLHVGLDREGDIPMLYFTRVPDENGDATGGMSTRKITSPSTADSYRVNIPSQFRRPPPAGIGSESEPGDGPLVFLPMYEGPEADFFALARLGFASELFNDPDEYLSNPLPNQACRISISQSELEEETSYTGGPVSVEHMVEFEEAGQTGNGPSFSAGDTIRIWRGDDTDMFVRGPDYWKEVDPGTYYSWLKKIPSTLTGTLFERAGFHSGRDPDIVERNGDRLEIHFVEPESLYTIATDVLGVSPEIAMGVDRAHQIGGMHLLEETFEARGEEMPDDHFAYQGEYVPVVIVLGEAKAWLDTEIAVDITDTEVDVIVEVAESSKDEQLVGVSTGDADPTDLFWQEGPFDIEDVKSRLDESEPGDEIVMEIANDYRVHESLVEEAIERLSYR